MKPLPLAMGVLVLLSVQPGKAWGQPRVSVEVDAREAARHLLHGRLNLPVTSGALTLAYPKWLPGTHGPRGPLVDLVGLRITGGGSRLPGGGTA